MLKSLLIKNFVLIDTLSINFEEGLNILTGETGTGKTIILDALSIVFGGRTNTSFIRKDSDKFIIEVVIEASQHNTLLDFIKTLPIDVTSELIIRRELPVKGQSRSFVNDTPTFASNLKKIGDLCIDFHGQHEHQSLLNTSTHLGIIDRYGNLQREVTAYRSKYYALKQAKEKLSTLDSQRTIFKEKKDVCEFQLNEIQSVSPISNEENLLKNEERVLENTEKLHEQTQDLLNTLYDGNTSLYNGIEHAKQLLTSMSNIDKDLTHFTSQAKEAQGIIDDITRFIQSYQSKIEFNPERLEEIRERLSALSILTRKYGGSINAVIEKEKSLVKELRSIDNLDDDISHAKSLVETYRKELSMIAKKMSIKRKEVAEKITPLVENELKKLGIASGKFRANFKHNKDEQGDIKLEESTFQATSQGYDIVEFMVSSNLGEPLRPLSKVASGGEISRIMLALKSILAIAEDTPILVFDEIDTGISGKIAQAVGESIKALSKQKQLIVITHLPQIAAFGKSHFIVEKKSINNRTLSSIRRLSAEEKRKEVAKLMSGSEVTDASLRSAQELIQANNV